MNPMSTETQPSEHAMRALSEIVEAMGGKHSNLKPPVAAHIIDQHAIAPAVAERDRRIAELLGALDKAVELCHAPERNQDGEWWEALGLVSAILAKHGGAHE